MNRQHRVTQVWLAMKMRYNTHVLVSEIEWEELAKMCGCSVATARRGYDKMIARHWAYESARGYCILMSMKRVCDEERIYYSRRGFVLANDDIDKLSEILQQQSVVHVVKCKAYFLQKSGAAPCIKARGKRVVPLSVRELARKLCMSIGAAHGMIDKAVKKGAIRHVDELPLWIHEIERRESLRIGIYVCGIQSLIPEYYKLQNPIRRFSVA